MRCLRWLVALALLCAVLASVAAAADPSASRSGEKAAAADQLERVTDALEASSSGSGSASGVEPDAEYDRQNLGGLAKAEKAAEKEEAKQQPPTPLEAIRKVAADAPDALQASLLPMAMQAMKDRVLSGRKVEDIVTALDRSLDRVQAAIDAVDQEEGQFIRADRQVQKQLERIMTEQSEKVGVTVVPEDLRNRVKEVWVGAREQLGDATQTMLAHTEALREDMFSLQTKLSELTVSLPAEVTNGNTHVQRAYMEMVSKLLFVGDLKRRCDELHNFNPCTKDPCLNDGKCLHTPQGYHCVCVEGWTGKNCHTNVDECRSGPCINGGTCVDGINSYVCKCKSGFEGFNCEREVDECRENPCQNGASCVDKIGDFECICAPGFTGKQCETNINDCADDPCTHGGTCIDGVADYQCECVPGWGGEDCSINIDDCSPKNPCANYGRCIDKVNGFECECAAGFEGDTCETNIDDCTPNPCQNKGKCVDLVDAFECQCAAGFRGETCGENIDDCAGEPCENGATCTDGINSYQCQCPPGFEGHDCEVDINECESQPCQNGGICEDKVNGFVCHCKDGWEGGRCEVNVDECSPNPCQNGGVCLDGIASFVCRCPEKYYGAMCESKRSECAGNPCQHEGECIEGFNTFTCKCKPGFRGDRCEENINECAPHPCKNGATCVDGINRYMCECAPGWEGENCERNKDECAPHPCQNGGTCVDGINSFVCKCKPGFRGHRCEENIDECATAPCKNGAECIDGVNDYRCVCKPGWEGKQCQTQTDNCKNVRCQNGGKCLNRINAFTCQCQPGFDGTYCEHNINECADNPCQHGGHCLDGINSYACKCAAGWEGKRCEVNHDDCAPNPCKNGGKCLDRVNGFTCECRSGTSGTRCEKTVFHTIPNTYTWSNARDYCERKGKRLCSHREVCPNGVGKPAIGAPAGSGHMWAPVFDRPKQYFLVRAGKTGAKVCEDHTVTYRTDPSWAQSTRALNFRGVVFCCDNNCKTTHNYRGYLHYATSMEPCIPWDSRRAPWGRDSLVPDRWREDRGIGEESAGPMCRDPYRNGRVVCTTRSGLRPCMPKCDALDVCAINPCQNGGKCVNSGSSFSCRCADTWYGRYCMKSRGSVHLTSGWYRGGSFYHQSGGSEWVMRSHYDRRYHGYRGISYQYSHRWLNPPYIVAFDIRALRTNECYFMGVAWRNHHFQSGYSLCNGCWAWQLKPASRGHHFHYHSTRIDGRSTVLRFTIYRYDVDSNYVRMRVNGVHRWTYHGDMRGRYGVYAGCVDTIVRRIYVFPNVRDRGHSPLNYIEAERRRYD